MLKYYCGDKVFLNACLPDLEDGLNFFLKNEDTNRQIKSNNPVCG